jgi:hypothetical protein
VLPRHRRQVLSFLKSALLQGDVLSSLRLFFSELFLAKDAALSYDTLLKALLEIADAKSSRQSLLAIAQCIAAVVSVAPAENFVATVSVFIGQIQNAAVPDHGKRISFFALGEIGRTQDLCSANAQVDDLIFAAFRCA